MKRATFRLTLLASIALLFAGGLVGALAARPETARAHPLGNFTINRYSRLELYADAIRVHYVLDMAEIPTFQEMDAIDRDGDGRVNAAENKLYASKKTQEIIRGLHIYINGSHTELRLLSQELTFPPGQGSLETLRLRLLLEATASGPQVSVEYRDDNYAERLGWKEIVVRAAEGVPLLTSTASSEDMSDELLVYPNDMLSSPPNISEAAFTFVLGSGTNAPPVDGLATKAAPERQGNGVASLIDIRELSLPIILLSLLAAFGFGALHALEPGHGKSFVAAYFVGMRGSARQALVLGVTVAATHTIGVLAIGLLTLYGSRYIVPERIYPWLSLASGIMVASLGLGLLVSRIKGHYLPWLPSAHTHGHGPHDEGAHDHEHDHPADQDRPLPLKGLITLGLADGLTPSPSVLIVLLAAISLDRIAFGVLLIAVFSLGLATVLTLVSLAIVYAHGLLERLGNRRAGLSSNLSLLRLSPLGGAVVLLGMGLFLAARALTQPGLLTIWP